jgi:methionine--tRNA ligase beta chain
MKKSTAAFDNFANLDIRVGEVLSVDTIDGSDKLFSLHVNLGEEYGTVEILTGIRPWYQPDELVGKKMLFLANLEPRPMMGRVSQGMMIAANGDDKPVLITVDPDLAPGSIIR